MFIVFGKEDAVNRYVGGLYCDDDEEGDEGDDDDFFEDEDNCRLDFIYYITL